MKKQILGHSRDRETALTLNRRKLLKLSAAGVGAGSMASIVSTSTRTHAQAESTQVNVLWKKPVTLHPLFSTAGYEQQVERLMFGSLVKMTGNLEPVPDLAESVDVSPDAMTYTFKLRPGIAFNDGEPLTTNDVAFTIERAVDKRTGSYWQGRLIGIEGAEKYSEQQADSISGLEVVDDLTISITLAEPDAAFLVNLASFSGLGILPAHVLSDIPSDQMAEHSFALKPTVSAGAYKFVAYETDQYLELERNSDFGGTAPNIDRIFMRILAPDVASAAFERGELDVMAVPVEELERTKMIPNATVVSVPSPSMDQIAINTQRPYFQDKRIRQAMMHAIDRQAIVDSLYQGEAEIVNSPIFGPEWMGVPEVNPYLYDPDKARQLLEEAGWDSAQPVELMSRTDVNRIRQSIAPIVQEQLKAVGMDTNLLLVEGAVQGQKYTQEGDYDLYLFGGGVYRADPSISALYYHSRNLAPAGGNGTRYVNEELDSLYLQGQSTSDVEERRRIYTEIATILNEEVPTVFLWSPNSIFAISERLQGFEAPSYIDNLLWDAEGWSVTV